MRMSSLFVYLCYGLEGKVVYVQVMKVHKESRGLPPLILKLGTRHIWVDNITLQLKYLWKITPLPIEWKAGWALEPVWMFRIRIIPLAATGVRSRTVRPVTLSLRCAGSSLEPRRCFFRVLCTGCILTLQHTIVCVLMKWYKLYFPYYFLSYLLVNSLCHVDSCPPTGLPN